MSVTGFLLRNGKRVLLGASAFALGMLIRYITSDNDREEDDEFDDDYESNPHRRTTGHPILPIDLFDEIYQLSGEGEANRILDKVQLGKMSVDDVRTYLHRPDIEPEQWRDFEDGWRPENW